MNNYEYIVASLPVIQPVGTPGAHVDAQQILDSLHELLSGKDCATLDFMLSGYDSETLGEDFYVKALAHGNRFISSFFAYDLDVRNVKVEYLNRSLGRPETQDMLVPASRENYEFEGRAEVLSVLESSDILKRERGLDDLMWKKIDEITTMDVFNLNAILGFVAKLKIVDRWEKLDPETGQELFRKLVEEIRSTYDNKKNNMI